MIVTITLNPAVDVTYTVDRLHPGETHRVGTVVEQAGGKGVNVARVLHQLGHLVTATGLLGGAAGDQIHRELGRIGLPETFIHLEHGATRRCVTVVDGPVDGRADERATVLNEPGPAIAAEEWVRLQECLRWQAADAAVVVMSGSLPQGLPAATYADLTRLIGPERCLVDTSGTGLVAAAEAGAALLKPNAAELREATGESDSAAGARALIDRGARAVVVTGGAAGMLAVTSESTWHASQPEHLSGNPTGAGDAATAALAAGLAARQSWPDLLREAVAWSAAAVPVAYAGEVHVPTLERLRPQVRVEEIR